LYLISSWGNSLALKLYRSYPPIKICMTVILTWWIYSTEMTGSKENITLYCLFMSDSHFHTPLTLQQLLISHKIKVVVSFVLTNGSRCTAVANYRKYTRNLHRHLRSTWPLPRSPYCVKLNLTAPLSFLQNLPRTVFKCFSRVNVSFFGSATFCAAFLISPSLLDFLNFANADDIWLFAAKIRN